MRTTKLNDSEEETINQHGDIGTQGLEAGVSKPRARDEE
jgi:hypothetical protein